MSILTTLALVALQATPTPFQPITNTVVVPQIGACAMDGGAPRLRLVQVVARVRLEEALAATTLEVTVENLTSSYEAFELLVPVPVGAQPGVCAGLKTAFTQDGTGVVTVQDVLLAGGMPSPVNLTERPVARIQAGENGATIEALGRLARLAHTPWPLEFTSHDLLHTPGFELAPNGQVTVRLAYTEPLHWNGNQALYTLPRSESHDSLMTPWGLDVRASLSEGRELANAYSPTHWIEVQHQGDRDLRIRFVEGRHPEPGPIKIALLSADELLSGAVLSQPSDAFDPLPAIAPGATPAAGTFLLHTGFKPSAEIARTAREITLVLDRSGSMSSGKLTQAREAALGVLGDLAADETFNVISYANEVSSLFDDARIADAANLEKARDYLFGLVPKGGTNIDAALRQGLQADPPTEGRLPLLLFLTDGLPTNGETNERVIGINAERYNQAKRRLFTFGVGHDVNAPLLDHLARSAGGGSHFVRPSKNIEERIGEVYQGLRGPVLTSCSLEVLDAAGNPNPGAVRHVLPARLPDLYEDDRLVIAGQYLTDDPLIFRITGTLGGESRHFDIPFDPSLATGARNDFVPTLWAGRQLATMTESIRQAGALPAGSQRDLAAEATRLDAILALSKRYGILGEYTGFLALTNTDLFDFDKERELLYTLLRNRAQLIRVGRAAVSQSLNSSAALTQETLNRLNRFVDGSMNEIQIASVRQVGGRAFFLRGASWIDSSLCLAHAPVDIDEQIAVGDERYLQLVESYTQAGRPGLLSLPGNILLRDGQRVLFIEGPH